MKIVFVYLILISALFNHSAFASCTPEVSKKKVLLEIINDSGEIIYSEKLKVRKKSKYKGLVSSPKALEFLRAEGSKNIKIGKSKDSSKAGGNITKIKKIDGTALVLIGGCPASKINFLTRKKKGKKPFVHTKVIKKVSKLSGIEIPRLSKNTNSGTKILEVEKASTNQLEKRSKSEDTSQQLARSELNSKKKMQKNALGNDKKAQDGLPAKSISVEKLRVETLVEGLKFKVGSLTMTVDENQPTCGQSRKGYVWLEHDSRDLKTTGFNGLQAEVRAMATHFEALCPDLDNIWLRAKGDEGFYEVVQEVENWQLKYTKQTREEAKVWRNSVHESVIELKSMPADSDHDLKNFGYYKADLVGKASNFNLYRAETTTKYGAYRLVILHNVKSDDEPVFDVRENGSIGGPSTGPKFTGELEKILKDSGLRFFPYEQLFHYISGYHNPKTDRIKVMGDKFVEPPHISTQINAYWENGEMFLSPYGTSIANVRYRSRNDIVTALGPSAPVKIDDPFALPDFGELPAEKPGPEYMARQANIRQTLLNKGLIYKNDAFWSEFKAYDLRRIFEAAAEIRISEGPAFGAILMRYLTVNSEKCGSTIKNPIAFKLDNIRTETDSWGDSTTTKSNIYDIIVPGRFRAELEERFAAKEDPDAGFKAMKLAFEYMQPGGLDRLAKELSETREWIDRGIKDVDRILAYGGSCGNPIQQQLEEMLFHLASGHIPGDVSRLSFANATDLSDSLYEAGNAPSLQGACVINEEFDGVSSTRTVRWCECVVDKVPQVKPEKVSEYVKRYAVLNRDVEIARLRMERGQAHPDNRLYSIRGYCTGQVN